MAHIGTGVPPVEAPPAAPTAPPRPRFYQRSHYKAPDVSQLDTRNAVQTLIEHDIRENPPPAPDRGAANQSTDTRSVPRAADGGLQTSPEPAAPENDHGGRMESGVNGPTRCSNPDDSSA